MPLTAIVDGVILKTPLLAPDTWRELHDERRGEVIILCPGCKSLMHAKQLGLLWFFAHNPRSEEAERCEFSGESAAHLALKHAIAKSAASVGAEVDLEHPFDGGRVDVLATLKSGRWALEAQISPLNSDEAIRRHSRYISRFGHCTWIHTGQRPWRRRVHALQIDDTSTTTVVGGVFDDLYGTIVAAPHPVTEAVPHILRDRYTYIFDDSSRGRGFGYYVDRAAVRGTARRPREPKIERGSAGGSDVCARSGSDLSQIAGGARIGEGAPCESCDKTTWRVGADGAHRHGWCETPPAWPWNRKSAV